MDELQARIAALGERARLSNLPPQAEALERLRQDLPHLRTAHGMDRAVAGVDHVQRERMRIVLEIVRRLVANHQHGASLDEIVTQAGAQGVAAHDVESTLEMLKRQGTLWSPSAPDRFKLVQE